LADALGVTAFEERQRAVAHALAAADLVIANSAFLARRLRDVGVPEERMLVIRQGIDTGEIVRTSPRGAGGPDGLRVLYLGQLTRHKGVDLLVKAVQQLADEDVRVELHLYGPMTDHPFAAALRRLDHPAITIGKPLAREQLAGVLVEHDVLVVPSRWYDNSPNVILEAFSVGVPVIAANHGGMAEMVHHQIDGLTFQPSDVPSLTEALRQLAQRPELLEQLRAGISSPHSLDVEMEAEERAIQAMLACRTGVALSGSGQDMHLFEASWP
jgi:glycosyltransferase involved in cell wall biosynthesis